MGSRVSFVDGQPDKSAYRRYRIQEAPAGDDLACMREVIARRLAKREQEPLPDLLMVDGGRGQLAVVSALAKDEGLTFDHCGLAKERDDESPSERVKRGGGLKAERIFLPNRVNPVMLPPNARGLLLLQRVRDEAHRFAIEFQRALRQKVGLTSILEEIPGIGPTKRRALLKEMGSLRRIRDAEPETLAGSPGCRPMTPAASTASSGPRSRGRRRGARRRGGEDGFPRGREDNFHHWGARTPFRGRGARVLKPGNPAPHGILGRSLPPRCRSASGGTALALSPRVMGKLTPEHICHDLEDRGVPRSFARPLAERLAASEPTDEAYEGLLTGAVLAYTVHHQSLLGLEKSASDLGEIQRLMTDFSQELRKLDEALEVLAAYVVRMKSQTEGSGHTLH